MTTAKKPQDLDERIAWIRQKHARRLDIHVGAQPVDRDGDRVGPSEPGMMFCSVSIQRRTPKKWQAKPDPNAPPMYESDEWMNESASCCAPIPSPHNHIRQEEEMIERCLTRLGL